MRLRCGSSVLVGVALLITATDSDAQPRMYRWTDENGVVHFSDQPPASQDVTAEALAIPSSEAPVGVTRPVVGTRTDRTAIVESNVHQPQSVTPASAPDPDCSSASPRQRSGRDLYEFTGERPDPLSAAQIESVEGVIEAMVGQWAGTETGFTCESGAHAPLPTRTISSEARLENARRFMLDSTMASRDRSEGDQLRIEIRDDNRLRVNQGDASLISVSERALSFGYAQRTGGAITELQWRIELDSRRNMTIERVTYVLGNFDELSIWKLEKPY
jgi:hypothetical protein